TKKVCRLSTERCRRAGRTWFVTFWIREPILSSSMPTARSLSISSAPAELGGDEAEAELRRLLLRATLRSAEAAPPPREPEVVPVLGVEASARRLQPRFARCCKTWRRRNNLRGTGYLG